MKRPNTRLLVTILSLTVMLLMTIAATFAAPLTTDARITFTPPPPTPDTQPLKPLVLLTIYNPWRMVIGSDEPTLALYNTGLVIYQRIGPADAPEFASVQLTDDEFTDFKAALKLDKALYALEPNTDYYTKTDQPTNVIRLFDPVLGEKVISIYGDLFADEEAREFAAPKRLINLFDTLANYSHPDAQTWLPDQFEVILWEYDTATATAWPRNWPRLDDPTTIHRDSVYSLYIDMEEFDHYMELRNTANAFRLDGKNWAFSARIPLPHERPIS